MKNKHGLHLPQALSNLPVAIACSALIGYAILDFENLLSLFNPNFQTGKSFKSFFTDPHFINHVPLLLLYLVQFCLYSILIVTLVQKITQAHVSFTSIAMGSLTIIILAFIFINFTVTTNSLPQIEIPNFKPKILILVVMGVFVSACIGILLFIQLKILDSGINQVNAFLKDKTRYFKVRKEINSLIYLFGVTISLATLATAAIQKIAGDTNFSKEAVYYYGILGSLLMGAIYLPLYLKYKALGYHLIEEFASEKGIQKDDMESISFYKKIEEELNLNVSIKDNIIQAIPIMAPSAAALLNVF